jgi:putative flavoprotein involved in K+ transport
VADYLEAYARRIAAPIRTDVAVQRLSRRADGSFLAETSAGSIAAQQVVVATGPFQKPVIPALILSRTVWSRSIRPITTIPPIARRWRSGHRRGILGVQIADELNRAGKPTWLAVGPHNRPPRRYRGKDFVWWLGVLGKWDLPPPPRPVNM